MINVVILLANIYLLLSSIYHVILIPVLRKISSAIYV